MLCEDGDAGVFGVEEDDALSGEVASEGADVGAGLDGADGEFPSG